MAEAADDPDVAVVIDWGRAEERPDMGSALEVGHILLAGRFREAHSPFAKGGAPFVCAEEAVMVEAAEADEASEDEELERWVPLRGISILDTSSTLMALRPLAAPLGALHPFRGIDWKFGGGATAVICEAC
jgi:hypothetical protein